MNRKGYNKKGKENLKGEDINKSKDNYKEKKMKLEKKLGDYKKNLKDHEGKNNQNKNRDYADKNKVKTLILRIYNKFQRYAKEYQGQFIIK